MRRLRTAPRSRALAVSASRLRAERIMDLHEPETERSPTEDVQRRKVQVGTSTTGAAGAPVQLDVRRLASALTGPRQAIMRDHSKRDARLKPSWRTRHGSRVGVHRGDLICGGGMRRVVRGRQASGGPSGRRAGACSTEQRWHKGEKWAVMARRKKALRLLRQRTRHLAIETLGDGERCPIIAGEDTCASRTADGPVVSVRENSKS